ncbi:hypothetical protein H9I32_01560 [Bacillus sp. Xin]|uniref:hypothetical protein n=1 Tax=unclassified Bacillus (in: firmicutes) TaxID=185979 RepID=UPI00157191B4|nr:MULTISPECIES: hypothetical protein [unclassified Bacillus (in: firmicutes)]MBC6971149.1 hypothetical protein [Bacillus sp. Xin]NSW39666.1 hypothetical protein [Bacillus sp. Xin1]
MNYQVATQIKVNKGSLSPYEVHVKVKYEDPLFKSRIQELVKKYDPVLYTSRRDFLTSWIVNSKWNVSFLSLEEEKRMDILRNKDPMETLMKLLPKRFDFQEGVYAFKQRSDAEEVSLKMLHVIEKFLEKESKIYAQIS